MSESLSPATPEAIKQERESAGWTQAQAAQQLHVDVSSYARWERGERDMPGAAWEFMMIKVRRKLGE